MEIVVLYCLDCNGDMFFDGKNWVCSKCWTTIYVSHFAYIINAFDLEGFCDNCHHRIYAIGEYSEMVFFQCRHCKRYQFYRYRR